MLVYPNTTRLTSFLFWYDVFACILNDFLRWEPLLHCLESAADWERRDLGGALTVVDIAAVHRASEVGIGRRQVARVRTTTSTYW